MRFTHSLMSFRSGRLSPRLFNRVDTTQYRDGMSELINFRPLVGGGGTRPMGTRQVPLYALRQEVYEVGNGFPVGYAAPAFLEDGAEVKSFNINVLGESCLIIMCRVPSNEVRMYIIYSNYTKYLDAYRPHPDPNFSTTIYEPFIQVIPEGNTKYSIEGFTHACTGDSLVIAHDSGTMCPFYLKFGFNGDDLECAVNPVFKYWENRIGPLGEQSFSLNGNPRLLGSGYYIDPRMLPLLDIAERSTVTLSEQNASARTISVTFTNLADYEMAVKSPILYIETFGNGKFEEGEFTITKNFPVGNFFILTDTAPVIGVGTWKLSYMFWHSLNSGAEPVFTFGRINKSDTSYSTNTWTVSAWRDGEYPKRVTTFEGRVIFAGTKSLPLTVFGSSIFQDFAKAKFGQIRIPDTGIVNVTTSPTTSGPTLITDPFVFGIRGLDDSVINNIVGSSVLFVGTDTAEYSMHGGDTALSALSVNNRSVSGYGSVPNTMFTNGKTVYFVTDNGRGLVKARYNPENGSTMDVRLDILIDDYLDDDFIKTLRWAPHINTLFVLLNSGRLLGIVESEQTETTAPYDTGLTDVVAISVNKPTPPDALRYLAGTAEESLYNKSYFDLGDHVSVIRRKEEGSTTDPLNVFKGKGTIEIYEPTSLNKQLERGITVIDHSENNEFLYYDKQLHFVIDKDASLTSPQYYQIYCLPDTDYRTTSTEVHDFLPISTDALDVGDEIVVFIANNADDENRQYLTFDRLEFTITEDMLNSYGSEYRLPLEKTISEYGFDPNVPSMGAGWYVSGKIHFILCKKKHVRGMYITSLPVEAGQQWGTAQMGIKNIDQIGLRAYKTYSVDVSSGEGTPEYWEEVVFADDEGKNPLASRKGLHFSSSPKYDQIIKLRNIKPEPCTITGINLRGVSNDG